MLKLTRRGRRLIRLEPPSEGTARILSQAVLREAIANSPREFFAEIGTEPVLCGRDVSLSEASRETADLLALGTDGRAHIVFLGPSDCRPVLSRAILSMAEISRWRYPDFVERLRDQSSQGRQSSNDGEVADAPANHSLSLVSDRFDFETLAAVEWLRSYHNIEIRCLRPFIAWDPRSQAQYVTFQTAPITTSVDDLNQRPAASPSGAPNRIVRYLESFSGWIPFRFDWNLDNFAALARTRIVGLAAAYVLPFAALTGIVLWMRESAPSRLQSGILVETSLTPSSRQATNVSGSVVDQLTGKPLPDCIISYGSRATVADSSGRFDIPRTRAGRQLFARAAGYRHAQVTISETFTTLRLQPLEVRALYLSAARIGSAADRQEMRRLLSDTGSNAIVFEVKSADGRLNLTVDHPLGRETGATGSKPPPYSRATIAEWKAAGFYTIALVSLFKDDRLAASKPSLALRSLHSNQVIRDSAGIVWVDPALSSVRAYNIAVAEAAAALGFDEILFDFVRYPAEAPSREGASSAEKLRRLAVLRDFLREVRQTVQPYPVFLGASMFGQTCTSPDVGVIGQRIEEFGLELDYICPMLYPSHFRSQNRYTNPLLESFQLVYENVQSAAARLGGNSARVRPWLQNFPDAASPTTPLKAAVIRKQVRAARAAGASGWMLWDARNHYRNTVEALDQFALPNRSEIGASAGGARTFLGVGSKQAGDSGMQHSAQEVD